MKKIRYCTLLLLLTIQLKAQLKLQNADSSLLKHLPYNELLSMETDTSLGSYRFIKEKETEYVVKYHSFDYPNELYWKLKERKIADSTFKNLLEIYKLHENHFFKSRKLHFRLKVLYGIHLNKNDKTITVDTDNDDDFTDEKQYTEIEFRNAGYIKVNNIETYISGTVVVNTVFIKFSNIESDTINYNEHRKKWSFDVLCKPMKYAKWKMDNKTTIKIIIPFYTYFGFEYKKKYTKIYIVNPKLEKSDLIPYKLTDTIIIGNKKIKFDTIDAKGNFLNYKILSNSEKISFGFNVGSIVEDIKLDFTNAQTSNIYQIKQLIVLDFWGSWCVPCKKIYPLIDSLRNEISKSPSKDSVIFINVAVESEHTLSDYHKEMKHKYLFWKSILLNGSGQNSIISKLHISAYPTLILIDTNHRILSRITGVNQFTLFKDTLKKYLLGF